MEYPQLHQIPKDARIRILDTDVPPVYLQHGTPKHRDDKVMSLRGPDDIKEAFAPFPVTFENPYGAMQAMNKVRQMVRVNAIEIGWQREPIPVRKKKSWLRYSSSKKWARKFPKRLMRKPSCVKVLELPKSLLDKIQQLQAEHPLDAAFMDGLDGG
jgi:hypothetical protein